MDALPIDPVLPEIVAALRGAPSLVIEAPPGAGKTTRVPAALLAGGIVGDREIVVLEPRRLAARLAARRVADELGEKPGETVGYQVRFEDVTSPRTRIRFVTEGLLTRQLLSAPTLPSVGAVLLDEFHERHLQGDLALALLRRLQRTSRPDLKLVAMSATLDAAPVAGYLGAQRIRSEGRRFEVAVEYLTPEEAAKPDVRPELRLAELVGRAVRRLVRELPEGHLLVFLPGAAEIRRAADALTGFAEAAGIDLLPLHGDLPPEEQDRAVRPSRRRKVLLSTNVAESSVTIDGVVAVVDSGLARIASHSPWSGLPSLVVRKVSRASAAQRAGRAGRQGPGRAVRLYTRHDHDTRPEFETPEIEREDLAETLLALASLGGRRGFEWFEPPPAAAEQAASALLRRLGATDAGGALTKLGRELLSFPLHPRQGRLLLEAARRGAGEEGALLAALLGERDLRDRRSLDGGRLPPTGPSDLLEIAQLFGEAERARFDPDRLRRMGLSSGAARAVDRSRRQLQRIARTIRQVPPLTPVLSPAGTGERVRSTGESEGLRRENALLMATLAAFPDRVGRRRAAGSDEVVLVGGGSARLDPASVVREAPLLVALDAEERKGDRRAPGGGRAEVRVRVASEVTQEMLLDLFPDALRYVDEVTWHDTAERVDAVERLLYEDLVLEEARAKQADPAKVAALLFDHAKGRGARAFTGDAGALDLLAARIAFAALHAPESGLTPPTDADFEGALRDLCEGRRSFAELRDADLPGALLGRLDPKARGQLERLAPERVTLPGGRGVRINYEAGKAPWIESRLQDFFGLAQGPALAGGRVPLVLHLLAPNQRAVQVTTDLAGFWSRHYPALRRELGRRYPRHSWPDDPLTAQPPAPRPPRGPRRG